MSNHLSIAGLALPILLSALPAAAAPAQPVAPVPPPAAAPPAPAIEVGERVYDRTGGEVGVVQGLVETPAGPMVVARIDGKLISLPQRTLSIRGDRIVSSQSKAQMVAAAGAPR